MLMKRSHFSLLTIIPLLSLLVSAAIPATVLAACNERLFTFPTWYNGLTDNDINCNIVIDELNDFWQIVTNLLEIGFQLVAYFALGYIIWGGFKYIKSEGNPNKVGEAKTTILYAIIGLGLALASVAMVNFVSRLFNTN